MINATVTQIFISTDPVPENPTREDFERMKWRKLCEIIDDKAEKIINGDGSKPDGILLKRNKPKNKPHGFKPPKSRRRWE